MSLLGFSLRPSLLIVGFTLGGLAVLMLLPAAAAFWGEAAEGWVFLRAAAITAFVAIALIASMRARAYPPLNLKQVFFCTVLAWAASIAFAALPFWLSGMSYTDAFFEACSGLTTTGATVYAKLDVVTSDILLWRAMLQWVGGIGIIVVAILLLPTLGVGGMQLFRSESSDISEKILPRTQAIGWAMTRIYLAFSLACWLAYRAAGMGGFDALLHTMTTISTGGFSNHAASLGYYDAPAIEIVACVFMLLGSLPFVAYLRLTRDGVRGLARETQIPAFAFLLGCAIAVMTLYLVWGEAQLPVARALRYASFNVTAIFTGTGYATQAFDSWGTFALMVFFIIAIFGGCAGSTAGGVKIFRLQVLVRLAWQHLRRLLAPNAVVALRYAGRALPESIALSAMIFLFSFVCGIVLLALFLSLNGLDTLSAWSGAVAALANVGPGLGALIGPQGDYATLTPTVKWGLAFGMLLGRLELFTILVLLVPRFWRA